MRLRLGYGTFAGVFVGLALVAASVADLRVSALDPWSDLAQVAAGSSRPTSPPGRSARGGAHGRLRRLRESASARRPASCCPWASSARAASGSSPAACARSTSCSGRCCCCRSPGISPWTGVLAVGLPYAGIFAKVFAEMMEEADFSAERALPRGTPLVSRFAFARAPILADAIRTYSLYRLECGLRSSLILGFIGIPTIGDEIKKRLPPGLLPRGGGAADRLLPPDRDARPVGARQAAAVPGRRPTSSRS